MLNMWKTNKLTVKVHKNSNSTYTAEILETGDGETATEQAKAIELIKDVAIKNGFTGKFEIMRSR